ncbi:MAG TPA: diguanylate cyclase, partial [Ardenticatenaceae bacterium]|nr:diguanylate cyclase [Ardenticatenaceae bacterium]
MEPLRPAARLYLAVLVLAALGAALAALARASVPDPDRLTLAVALTGVAFLAWLFPLHISAKTKLYFDNAVLVAAIILFEPGIALLVMGAGTVVAHALRRQPWDQTLFNSAQVVLLTVAGGWFLAATGWRVDRLALDQLEPVLLIVAVSVVLMVGSALAVATMVALQLNEPLPHAWADALFGIDRAEALADLAQVGLGLLVAGVADTHSWMLALLLLPAASTYRALDHHVRLRRDAEARLVHQAYHDPLTNLPNRALLLDHLEQALARAGRRGEPVALLFLDLDRYKLVNDRLGHAAGDRLLVAVADRLQRCARP